MSGIIALYIKDNYNFEFSNINIKKIANTIIYNPSDKIKYWHDDRLFVISVRRKYKENQNSDFPIFNKRKNLCIFMDGEIFDYDHYKKDLINKGYVFNTNSDAEFCLNMFEEYGKNSFKKLNGSFSILIYDLFLKEINIVSDRFSSRPIYYYIDNQKNIIATQCKALLEFPGVRLNINWNSIFEFFVFERVLTEHTFYKEVNAILPAHILQFRNNNINIFKYWEIEYKNEKHSESYYIELLSERLKSAVDRRTRDNKKFGILLSGGLDSRAILAADYNNKIRKGFSVGDFVNREIKVAKEIAKTKNIEHYFLQRNPDHYINIMDEAIEIGDGMYRYDHAHFLGFMDFISERCDILLHGHGLDYTFQGLYQPYSIIEFLGKKVEMPKLEHYKMEGIVNSLINRRGLSNIPLDISNVFNKNMYNDFIDNLSNSMNVILKDQNIDGNNFYNVWDYFILHSLSKHFTFLNFLCVRHFINERTLIYDNDLFDLYLMMPSKYRIKGRVYRKAIKRLNKDMANIFNSNTNLPANINIWMEWFLINNSKLKNKFMKQNKSKNKSILTEGSWPNFGELIRNNGKMNSIIKKNISDERIFNPNIFNLDGINRIYKNHLNNKENNSVKILLLITFSEWFKKYGVKNI